MDAALAAAPDLVAAPDPADADPRAGRALPAVFAPLRSALALPAAAAALVAGAAHVPVTADHLDEVPYVGWMFVALVAVCAVGAVTLAVRDVAAAYAGLAVAGLASVAFYVVSRGPGMPGMSDDVGDWANQLGLVSVASESLLVALAVAALARGLRGRTRVAALTFVPAGAAVAVAAGLLIGSALS